MKAYEESISDKDSNSAIVLNQALVDELKNKGIIQTMSVESAFQAVLRHIFLPNIPLEQVYSDRAISAKQNEAGQWISSSSQPTIMAIMLEQLDLQPGHKVLEIGTGPGYNAALMAHIVGETGKVVTVEIDEDLTEAAREHLASAGFDQVQVVCADGGYGYPDAAPFDRIILTVGAPDITPAWWKQMKPEGRLVLPLMLRGSMKSIAFERIDDHLNSISVNDCGFIQLRGDFASAFPNRVQLDPDPNLYIEPTSEFSIDSETTYSLLTGVTKDWATDVEVNVWDVLGGSLWTWLALHEPHMCKLIAMGDVTEESSVPPLIKIETKQNSMGTPILVDKTGLAALMRPPDEEVPVVTSEKLFAPDSPAERHFPLFVRQFGTDESVAQRLLALIQTWKAADNPSSNNMHIQVYPKDFDYKPSEGEIVLQRQWTKLVIEWSLSDADAHH
jgi:protein-L-isoaspartate(D-aspartate) O-methyltransferase